MGMPVPPRSPLRAVGGVAKSSRRRRTLRLLTSRVVAAEAAAGAAQRVAAVSIGNRRVARRSSALSSAGAGFLQLFSRGSTRGRREREGGGASGGSDDGDDDDDDEEGGDGNDVWEEVDDVVGGGDASDGNLEYSRGEERQHRHIMFFFRQVRALRRQTVVDPLRWEVWEGDSDEDREVQRLWQRYGRLNQIAGRLVRMHRTYRAMWNTLEAVERPGGDRGGGEVTNSDDGMADADIAVDANYDRNAGRNASVDVTNDISELMGLDRALATLEGNAPPPTRMAERERRHLGLESNHVSEVLGNVHNTDREGGEGDEIDREVEVVNGENQERFDRGWWGAITRGAGSDADADSDADEGSGAAAEQEPESREEEDGDAAAESADRDTSPAEDMPLQAQNADPGQHIDNWLDTGHGPDSSVTAQERDDVRLTLGNERRRAAIQRFFALRREGRNLAARARELRRITDVGLENGPEGFMQAFRFQGETLRATARAFREARENSRRQLGSLPGGTGTPPHADEPSVGGEALSRVVVAETSDGDSEERHADRVSERELLQAARALRAARQGTATNAGSVNTADGGGGVNDVQSPRGELASAFGVAPDRSN